jgi:hypothetical protein
MESVYRLQASGFRSQAPEARETSRIEKGVKILKPDA